MTNHTISRIFFSVVGVLVAFTGMELALRPWASAWREKPYARPAEVRQYYEGISTAHYAADGERLTGNPPIPGAPNILILGDSHVEAVQVSDHETMGALLEQDSRSGGRPCNVHQYGWSFAAAPLYALFAPQLLERWRPDAVVVMINTSDIEQAFIGPVRIDPADQTLTVIDERAVAFPTGWQAHWGAPVLKNSVLIYHLYSSARLIQEAALLPPEDGAAEETGVPMATPEAPRTTVRLLKAAYGARLVIVYDMYLHGLHTATVDDDHKVEQALLAACAQENIACVSTRNALIQDRMTRSRFSRGFSNSPPGEGHWNQAGHEILAQVIWDALQEKSAGGR